MTKRKTTLLAFAAFSALPLLYSHPASACGSAVRLEVVPQKPTPVQEVARAEKALEVGQSAIAARVILTTFPRVRSVTAGDNPLETRALRVFALAVVRSEGVVNEKTVGVPSQTEWTTNANLAWAVQAMREINAKRPNDPTVQADLGEALSKVATGRDEAFQLLSNLAQKDLMGSPNAYAALATLRKGKGDLVGADAATKRCEEMSKTPALCRPATKAAKA